VRKLQVYLASNYEVNGRDRYDVERELLRHGAFVSGLACREDADYDWELARRIIDECDYFVCLLGDSYGPMSPNGLSFLHREFVHAQSQSKPVISFIKNVHSAGTQSEEGRRLAGFQQIVSQQNYRLWHLRDELVSHVKVAIPGLLAQAEGGWQKVSKAEPAAPVSSLTKSLKTASKVLSPSSKKATSSKSTSSKSTVRLQMSAKVYQAGNNQLKEASVTERWDRIFGWVADRMTDDCSDDYLREIVEQQVADQVEQKLLLQNPDAHAVDDVRVNRVQFHRLLEEWVEAGYIVHVQNGHHSSCHLTDEGKLKKAQKNQQ